MYSSAPVDLGEDPGLDFLDTTPGWQQQLSSAAGLLVTVQVGAREFHTLAQISHKVDTVKRTGSGTGNGS